MKQWLVRALYRALREESPKLTSAHLEKSVLPDAKSERMRADARSGEAEFQYADGQNNYLANLASMSTFAPPQPDPASSSPSIPPEDGTADQKTRKPKGRVGEPSPRRGIRWERRNRREKPPIVLSQGQSNWRRLVGW
ncbi:MAG TPA: hypothetical protein VFN02_12730 [Ktedonobacteraceae bacterium]|nr:hypothetical protein [Ktedonobacteraceae bacterium]